MGWRGIPKLMHRREYDMNLPGNHPYVCGEPFRSWSDKWMNAKSDTCEIEGERVFRFTAGKEVQHLHLCPVCWGDTHRTIPAPVVEEVEEFEDTVEESIVRDEVKGESIYLWDSLNSSND